MGFFIGIMITLLVAAFVFLSLYTFMKDRFPSPVPIAFSAVTAGVLIIIGFYTVSLLA